MRTRYIRTYSELINIPTFKERYEYLKLGGIIGESTFGYDRYLNQVMYRSGKWRRDIRDSIIIRDCGNDLAMDGYYIRDRIIIHHINPITVEDLENEDESVFDPENLICVSPRTHNAIHFGDATLLPQPPVKRMPGDTCPWK